MERNLLEGKKVLIVDDEPDVLEMLGELLSMCEVLKASSFQEAERILRGEKIDIAVLDIMGVNGYELLNIANERGVIAVMLTAHALTPGNIVKSFEGGAASYIPKEELEGIADFIEELLEAKAEGRHFWSRWVDRWKSFYDKKFGPDWQEDDREFWEKFKYWI